MQGEWNIMKKLFKKNQIIITALALMIAAAGYLSYTYSGTGGNELEQASADLTNEDYDIISEETVTDAEIFTEAEINTDDTDKKDTKAKDDANTKTDDGADKNTQTDDNINNPGETVLTSSGASGVNFAVEAKLNREQVRSQNKEDLMDVINSTALSDKEKQAAVDKMVALTDIAQRESDAEMLLEAKGFTDVVVNVTEDSADVVLNMGDVTDAKRAQIEDIVKRKTKISAENIVITPITSKETE